MEQSHTQSNGNEANNNDYLIEHEELDNTPFQIIKKDNKYFIGTGNLKLTKNHDTKEEAIWELETDKWKIILSLIIYIGTKINEDERLAQKIKEKMAQEGAN